MSASYCSVSVLTRCCCLSCLSSTEASIETDFSGTTFTCAIIRGNKATLCNIGDSRSSLGYRNASGGETAT